jgi:streptomycin 6-kinase
MADSLSLPDDFVRNVRGAFAGGAAWLERLPDLLSFCREHWGLTLGPPFAPLSYNYVAPAALPGGETAVLKLGAPNDELRAEIAALRLYDGRAICRLLDADAERGILLLERVQPGRMLTTVADDAAATRQAAAVMRRLWRPLPAVHPFPTVADWGRGFARLRAEFAGGAGPFPPRLAAMAETLFADLLASSAEPVLLHGDLHHYNILAGEREAWLAIDPKGVAGEPAYEVGALIRNPLDVETWPDLEPIMARRFDILAEVLEMDRGRLLRWSLAQEVLSAWWSYEDTGDAPGEMRLATLLAEMIG